MPREPIHAVGTKKKSYSKEQDVAAMLDELTIEANEESVCYNMAAMTSHETN